MPQTRYTVSTKAACGLALPRHVKVSDDHLASYVLRYPVREQ